mgnify:CR=1 FL=1
MSQSDDKNARKIAISENSDELDNEKTELRSKEEINKELENNNFDLSNKMSINMKDSDIRNVLELIGELTGLNIVISPEVQDTVTANLSDVSVKAALDAILQPNGYSYFIKENIQTSIEGIR